VSTDRAWYAEPKPYFESFNGRLRDEGLSVMPSEPIKYAGKWIEAWRIDYNTRRLRSSRKQLTPIITRISVRRNGIQNWRCSTRKLHTSGVNVTIPADSANNSGK